MITTPPHPVASAATRRRPALPARGVRGPVHGAASRAALATPTGPRLLLPPVVDPEGARPAAVAYLPPSVRALGTSPVTDTRRDVWVRADAAPEPAPVALPDPAAACGVIALAVVEMLAGRRSPAQLTRWVSPDLYDRLVLRAASTRGAALTTGRPVRLLSTRPCRVDERVAEASVVLHDGSRVRAAAVRVEEHRGRWRATVVEIG